MVEDSEHHIKLAGRCPSTLYISGLLSSSSQVRSSCLSHFTKRRKLPSAQNSEEYVILVSTSAFSKLSAFALSPSQSRPSLLRCKSFFGGAYGIRQLMTWLQEAPDSRSEYGDDLHSLMSAVSANDLNTLNDVSTEAL